VGESGGDGDRVGDAAHQNRSRRIRHAVIPKFALAVKAPAPHPVIFLDLAGETTPGSDPRPSLTIASPGNRARVAA
jgi:hypothetical protein